MSDALKFFGFIIGMALTAALVFLILAAMARIVTRLTGEDK